jgi:putative ABC transport system permease protein
MIYSPRFYLKIALQNLILHKARMILALLGVLFAVMSLVAFGNISEGMKEKLDEEIERFGKNLMIVRAGQVFFTGRSTRQFQESQTLKPADAQRIKQSLPGVEEVVPFYDVVYPARYQDKRLRVTIMGVSDSIFKVRDVKLAAGRSFSAADVEGMEKKAVIGYKVFDSLMGREDPIGKHLLIFRAPTEIIGVMEERGSDFTGQDQDVEVYIPLSTFMRRYSNVDYIKGIYVQTKEGQSFSEMKVKLRQFLRKLHNLREDQKDDFTIFTQEDILRTREEGLRLVSVLTVIASTISFLIGGLGIFAIMLLSVSERKMEIGMRRVVGSKKRDILFQFLAESVITALVGGALGVVVGLILTIVVDYIGGFAFCFCLENTLVALCICTVVGVLAGIYPAVQSTRYEPVAALQG